MNIALTGGGTAGHIMPNIALLPHLKNAFNNILYIGNTNGLEHAICLKNDINFAHCDSIKFDRVDKMKNFKIPFALPQCVKTAKSILKNNKINIVFSKGGYMSLPTVLAAKQLGIPVVCHESDSTLGLANKLTSMFACKTITSYKTNSKKQIFIGNPLREEIFLGDSAKAKVELKIENSLPVLLIVGGSLGAKAINEVIFASLNMLCERFNVVHICGKNPPNVTLANYFQLEFVDNIADYLVLADYVVARSGASLSGELSALNKNVLYIPLPTSASRGDQVKNAELLQNQNFAMVLEQENLSPTTLCDAIDKLTQFKKSSYHYDRNIPKRIVEQIECVAFKAEREKNKKYFHRVQA